MRNTLHDVSVLKIGLHTAITISGSYLGLILITWFEIFIFIVTWPYADDDLRADSFNFIEENNDITKVNSIHVIRLIARQLSDEFLSVFVLDINGLVRKSASRIDIGDKFWQDFQICHQHLIFEFKIFSRFVEGQNCHTGQ